MKVLYLFNKVIGDNLAEAKSGVGHDSWLFGMIRLPKYGVHTGFLEIEQFLPKSLCRWLRRHILTMHYAHLPLFPLFFRYDVVFTSTAYGSLLLKALFRIKKFKWVILDFNLLGTIQNRKTLKQKFFYWAVSKGADGIVAISEAEAKALKKEFSHLSDRIIFLHEATDTSFFKPLPVVEKHQVISVGNYGRDFDVLIKAVDGLGVDLLLVTKLISPKQTSLLPGYVKVKYLNHQDMVGAYAESKVVVVSVKTNHDYFDSVGTLSLGESLAMGKPTVVTRTKNMTSYIKDKENGLFVEPGNSDNLRYVILDLLNKPYKREALGREARRFAEAKLDPDLFAEKLALFLKGVV